MTQNSTKNTPLFNFSEMDQLLGELAILEPRKAKGLSAHATTLPQAAQNALNWLATSQNSCHATLDQARLILFASHHGFAKNDAPQYNDYVKKCLGGTASLNKLALLANCDFRLFEMDLDNPTPDLFGSQINLSMDQDSLLRCMAYGMMAVEPNLNLIAGSAFGAGSQLSAEALIAIHAPELNPEKIQDLNLTRLIKICGGSTGFDSLAKIGGYEMAALIGLITAARLAQISILLEGKTGLAALLCLQAQKPNSIQHCALTGIAPEKIPTKIKESIFVFENALPSHSDETGIAMTDTVLNLKRFMALAS
jgi:nicotinate-nucleotide--dimethylbenzimidazole phosphoribosyltransferase